MGGRICKHEYAGACQVGARRVGVHRGNSSQHHALFQLWAELPPSMSRNKATVLMFGSSADVIGGEDGCL